jgi:hypothetical protein
MEWISIPQECMLRAVWWRNWVASSWCNRADTCGQIRGRIFVPVGGPTDTWGKKGTKADTISCPLAATWDAQGTEGTPSSCPFMSQFGLGGEFHGRGQGSERDKRLLGGP